MIDAVRLREILHYDPITGVFTWREKICAKVVIGREAGSINADGYVVISINGDKQYAHRLAWLYMTGDAPIGLIDHENLNKGDNRWENIRLSGKSGNAANAPLRSTNTSGYKGVTWHGRAGKWSASIVCNGVNHYLGLFEDPAKAGEAYAHAADRFFGKFARTS